MDNDHYCYENSDTLVNKFDIKNPEVLYAIERNISTAAMKDILASREIKINGWGLNTLCRIHKVLFGEIYPWAGHIRNGNIGKDGLGFCDFKTIKGNLSVLKKQISDLKDSDMGHFVFELASIHAVLNSIHPFREGNGRTMRTFLTLYARSRGYDLNYSHFPKKQQLEADRQALSENPDSTALAVMYASICSEYKGKQKIKIVGGSSVKEPLLQRKKGIAHER